MKTNARPFPPVFTLIELLVVIGILGILAGLTVPVLKNFAKSGTTLGVSLSAVFSGEIALNIRHQQGVNWGAVKLKPKPKAEL
jgi:prepilin-type N-terminal cleavage/methylation domain-containing protein